MVPERKRERNKGGRKKGREGGRGRKRKGWEGREGEEGEGREEKGREGKEGREGTKEGRTAMNVAPHKIINLLKILQNVSCVTQLWSSQA